jgi:hypothetical protein
MESRVLAESGGCAHDDHPLSRSDVESGIDVRRLVEAEQGRPLRGGRGQRESTAHATKIVACRRAREGESGGTWGPVRAGPCGGIRERARNLCVPPGFVGVPTRDYILPS